MTAAVLDEKPVNVAVLPDKEGSDHAVVLDFMNEKQQSPTSAVVTPPPKQEPEADVPEPAWATNRAMAVRMAVAAHDDSELARLSALPGGFGTTAARRVAWIELLHADELAKLHHASRDTTPETDMDGVAITAPHPDEHQVLLDTRRAFVTYPRGLSGADKAAMQDDLQRLIATVLQRHPRLSYFQGFHDIATVLYLTLLSAAPRPRSEEEALTPRDRAEWAELVRAAELVALCRTRDAMGKDLSPMMGMLRLLRRLLAAADPQLYRVSASISPVPTLPFFALSWILTLFSHDVDTLQPVQRIFDYLIARNPISAIYLAVAILIAKKPQMARLVKQLGPEAQRDPSLLHPLFARLPPLYCDTPDAPTPPTTAPPPTSPHAEPNPYTPIALSTVFKLADKLFAKFPPDGPVTRAHEVLGQGSMVRTYSRERDEDWGLRDAEAAIDSDVILPGGDEADEDASLVPDCRLSPRRLDHLSTAVAVGIVVVGIGAAVLGWQGRHADPQWARFWGMVATQAAAKSNSLINSWVAVNSYFTRTLREVL